MDFVGLMCLGSCFDSLYGWFAVLYIAVVVCADFVLSLWFVRWYGLVDLLRYVGLGLLIGFVLCYT